MNAANICVSGSLSQDRQVIYVTDHNFQPLCDLSHYALKVFTCGRNAEREAVKGKPLCAVLQNKPVMVFGLVTITLCVGYLGYLHAAKENDQQLYEAIDSEGERYMRRKTSKWD
uniref:Small integral membrane protein 8 n=1 Tax=Seriola lalandi dorsalis TaxID=1841481 RepID=A0A3B4WVQ9_SERLL